MINALIREEDNTLRLVTVVEISYDKERGIVYIATIDDFDDWVSNDQRLIEVYEDLLHTYLSEGYIDFSRFKFYCVNEDTEEFIEENIVDKEDNNFGSEIEQVEVQEEATNEVVTTNEESEEFNNIIDINPDDYN